MELFWLRLVIVFLMVLCLAVIFISTAKVKNSQELAVYRFLLMGVIVYTFGAFFWATGQKSSSPRYKTSAMKEARSGDIKQTLRTLSGRGAIVLSDGRVYLVQRSSQDQREIFDVFTKPGIMTRMRIGELTKIIDSVIVEPGCVIAQRFIDQ